MDTDTFSQEYDTEVDSIYLSETDKERSARHRREMSAFFNRFTIGEEAFADAAVRLATNRDFIQQRSAEAERQRLEWTEHPTLEQTTRTARERDLFKVETPEDPDAEPRQKRMNVKRGHVARGNKPVTGVTAPNRRGQR